MSWDRASQIAERVAGTLALLALAGSALYCARKVGQASNEAMVTLGKLDSTVDTVNRPCGAGKPCGTLAVVNKTFTKAGDAIVTTQLAERAEVPHIIQATKAVTEMAGSTTTDVHTLAVAGAGTLQAGMGTLRAIQSDADAARPAVVALTSAVTKLGTAADDLDAQIKAARIDKMSKAYTAAADELTATMVNVTAISADAKKVADKETADFLRPVPWWRVPIKRGGELVDITAAVARHTP